MCVPGLSTWWISHLSPSLLVLTISLVFRGGIQTVSVCAFTCVWLCIYVFYFIKTLPKLKFIQRWTKEIVIWYDTQEKTGYAGYIKRWNCFVLYGRFKILFGSNFDAILADFRNWAPCHMRRMGFNKLFGQRGVYSVWVIYPLLSGLLHISWCKKTKLPRSGEKQVFSYLLLERDTTQLGQHLVCKTIPVLESNGLIPPPTHKCK